MEKEFLYKLIYYSLIEIREESSEIKNKRIFWISNLLHNLPLELEKAEGNNDFKQILKELEKKSRHDGMEAWFNIVKETIIKESKHT